MRQVIVLKYEVEETGRFTLQIPKNVYFLQELEYQEGTGFVFWGLMSGDADELERRDFVLLQTGEIFTPKDKEELFHIGTKQVTSSNGYYVVHLFEIEPFCGTWTEEE